jgi:hypothetical protein
MATPVELERLIVRLLGDTTAYKRALEDAQKVTDDFAGDATVALNRAQEKLAKLGQTSAVVAGIAFAAESAANASAEFLETGSRAQDTARFIAQLSSIAKVAAGTLASLSLGLVGLSSALSAAGVSTGVLTAALGTLSALLLPITIVVAAIAATIATVTFAFKQMNKEGDAALEALNKQTEELNASLDKQLEKRKQERRAATDYIRELKIQADTFGLSSRAARIYRVSLGNVTDEQLKQIRAADENLTKLEKQKEAMEAQTRFQAGIDKFNESLQLQAATFGLTARQAEIYRLRTEGASEAQLRQVISADKQLTLLEKQNEEMKKGEAISKRFFRAMEQNRKATEAQGKAITRQFLTPSEKLIERMKDLNRLLRVGAINQKTFERASLDAVRQAIEAIQPGPSTPARLEEAISTRGPRAAAKQEEFLASLGVGEKARPIEKEQLEELKKIEKAIRERVERQGNDVNLEEANFRV